MRAKLTIFIFSAFFLWSSLLTVSHHDSLFKRQEIKISAKPVGKAIVSDEDFIWGKTSCQLPDIFIGFAKAKINAEQLCTTFRVAQKSVKHYLLFRVLRN